MVVQHAKGFQDWSTYKADTRHVKIERNFWTHCITIGLEMITMDDLALKLEDKLAGVTTPKSGLRNVVDR